MFDRDEQEISQIIDNGLEAIRAGRTTLEQVLEQQELLAQHPQQAEAIRAELEAGLWLIARRKEVEARPGFVSASRKRVLERIQAEARSQGTKHAFFGFAWPKRITFQWVIAALVLILVLTSTGGIVRASQTALPGDNLYAIKRASEQVAYSVTLNEVQRVELSRQFAGQRLKEVEQLVAISRYTEAKQTIMALEQQVNQTVALLEKVNNAQAPAKLAAAQAFKADLSRNNDRLTNLMASAPPDMQGSLQDALTVMTRSTTDTEHLIDTIPGVEATPTPTLTLTPTGERTATPEATDTPGPDEIGSPEPAGINTPSTGSTDEDETATPTPDDASKTPKPSHTPKANDNNSNNNNKQPDNPNKPDKPPKPPKDPPPGQNK